MRGFLGLFLAFALILARVPVFSVDDLCPLQISYVVAILFSCMTCHFRGLAFRVDLGSLMVGHLLVASEFNLRLLPQSSVLFPLLFL